MSNVKIKANASGTADFTIQAPATDSAVTMTLPSDAGTILTDASDVPAANLTGTLPAIDGSALTGVGGGITEHDVWRMTANITPASYNVNTDITSNLERVDTDGFVVLGTGMSHSLGVFTFPSTGYWNIRFRSWNYSNTQENDSCVVKIRYSSDSGSNWDDASSHLSSIYTGDRFAYMATEASFKITNTSTQKVKFTVNQKKTGYFGGDTNSNATSMIFTKLAEV